MGDGPVSNDSADFPKPISISPPQVLRVWPGLLIVAVQLAVIFIPSWIAPGTLAAFLCMFYAPLVGAGLLLVWWVFFSRAQWTDRILIPVAAIGLGLIAVKIADKSMPFGLLMYGIPTICAIWAAWLAASGGLSLSMRRAGLLVLFVAAWGYFCTIRLDGIEGNMASEISWRWEPTAEQQFLAAKMKTPSTSSDPPIETEPLVLSAGDWPEFRGPRRDGIVLDTPIAADWMNSPPKLLWKQRIGPGWGSFCVIGDHLFSQEQRGDDEAVVCYSAIDGHEQWVHIDSTRFWEVVGGAGPRATPTFHEGRLYTLGANGLLNCLNATSGKKIWSVAAEKTADAKTPMWGFSGSPLIVGELVLVLMGSPSGSSLLAFDASSGEERWASGPGTHSYSSAQRANIAGVEQVLSMTNAGLAALNPVDGTILWEHAWPIDDGYRAIQPLVTDDTVLIGSPANFGCRLIRVTHAGNTWTTAKVWDSVEIKPNFNDYISLDGHLYGFDGNVFACIDLMTGKRRWKRGRYGFGQVLLVQPQNLLVIQAESGEVALVEANSKSFVELGKFPALEGKTWNHPVIARGKLFVRNGEEMACFDVTPAETRTAAFPTVR